MGLQNQKTQQRKTKLSFKYDIGLPHDLVTLQSVSSDSDESLSEAIINQKEDIHYPLTRTYLDPDQEI